MPQLIRRLTTLLACCCLSILPLAYATDFTALDQGISGSSVVVDAIAATTAGGLYVGGVFSTIAVTGTASLTANNVAFWNGTTWSTLGGGVNGRVTSIAIRGNMVLVGGSFSAARQNNGTLLLCNNLVQWNINLNNWSVVGTNQAGGGCLPGPITSLAYDSRLRQFWIGGTFDNVNNLGFSTPGTGNLATYDPITQNLLPFAFAPNNTISAITVDTTADSAYFGGLFTSMSGSPNSGFFKTTGGAQATAPDLAQTAVDALAVDASHAVYIGGNFTFPGSTPSSAIAMLTSAGTGYVGLGSGLTTGGSQGTVLAILVPGTGNTNPVVGGTFDHAGATAVSNLATWNPGTSTWSSYVGNTNGAVEVLATDSFGSVYVGGAFTTAVSTGATITSAIVRVGPSLAATTTTSGSSSGSTSGTGSASTTSGSTSSTTATTGTSATATSAGSTVVPSGGSSSSGCGLGSSLGVLVLLALLLTYRRLR